jgi:hypothetical protein
MSYARKDNGAPPEKPDAPGFVTSLHGQLEYELTKLGEPRPDIWWDDAVEDGDLFNPKIQAAIEGSSLFLVVLSRNWLHRPYCLKELELFRQVWSREPEFDVEHRVIVVRLNLIDESTCPALLTGQVGYRFYKFSGPEVAGDEILFFDRGEIRQPAYMTAAKELGRFLWMRASRLGKREPRASALALPGAVPTLPAPSASPPAKASAAGRSIYLAKPGLDLRQEYHRIAEDLSRNGFDVRLREDEDVPCDDSAAAVIDDAIGGSEVSIHLLGNDPGFAPAGCEHRIVQLQLARARLRAESATLQNKGAGFRRIIWAPKVLDGATTPDQKGVARDPLDELNKLDRFVDTDKVDGSSLTDFLIFLKQNLRTEAPPPADGAAPVEPGKMGYYVCHRSEDRKYAVEVAKALKQRRLEPILPAVQGEPNELIALHRQRLVECDNVVLCWGSASEVWAKTNSRELKDWQKLGRSRMFRLRGLVVGPPSDDVKTDFVDLCPSSEIDVLVDLRTQEHPTPEALAPLDPGH